MLGLKTNLARLQQSVRIKKNHQYTLKKNQEQLTAAVNAYIVEHHLELSQIDPAHPLFAAINKSLGGQIINLNQLQADVDAYLEAQS